MAQYKDNDSSNEQEQYTFRPRPKMGLLSRIVTAAAMLPALVFGSGCPRYDLYNVPSPDNLEQQVVNSYQSKLEKATEKMGIYDSITKKYDVDKLREEVKKQTQKVKRNIGGEEKTIYSVINQYDVNEILATSQALEIAIRETDKLVKKETNPKKKKEMQEKYQSLVNLVDDHNSALRWYHKARGAAKGQDKTQRQLDFFALEVKAYADEDFDEWKKLAKRRGILGSLEDSDEYKDVALWYPDDVRKAHDVRDQIVAGRKAWWKKNGWWVGLLVAGGIAAACDNDGGSQGPGNIGGEDGGIGGH